MLPAETEGPDYEIKVTNQRYYALVIVGIILPFLIEPFLSRLFLQKGDSFSVLFITSRFIIWGTLGLLYLYSRYGEVQRFTLWGEEEYGFVFYLKWIFLVYLMCIGANIIATIPGYFGLHKTSPEMLKLQNFTRQYPAFAYLADLTAGITEELVFRAYIISRLALFFKNKHYAVLISSILFCAVHIGYHDWGEIIFTFLLGLIFGYFYYRYRNIKVLNSVHFLVDAVATTLILLYHR